MDKVEQVYRDLQVHLDRMPVNYPATRSGVEIRILKHLFTPEEAEIALHLSMLPEPVTRIHKRLKKSPVSLDELKKTLDQMVYKGNIIGTKENDEMLYSNAPLAIGMFEFQVDRISEDLARDWLLYLDEAYAKEQFKSGVPQLRTIPIEKSIPLPEKYQVSDYDNLKKLVENAPGPIAVANCICRQVKDLVGDSCKVTDLRETCLIISPHEAEYYSSVGIGRMINREEAFSILEKAQEAGLVLQPVNSLRPDAICCCCGDCCGLLTSVMKFPRPADFYASNYYAVVNSELCTGCQTCTEHCQLAAASMSDGLAVINLDRCIGCGNCVTICEFNAISLRKKDKETKPPKDMNGLQMKILSNRISKFKLLTIGAKVLLKQKV
ncbi:MAG TPA: 4Fe-4S binding protein [Dehalococcoidia bacterium]|nr:4Fe-4S binding protein [Dehalococcoidia bacterium]